MQVTLTEREIHIALRKYIVGRLRLSANEEIKVDLLATRGADGFKAILDIVEPDETDNTFPVISTGECIRSTAVAVSPSEPIAAIPAPAVVVRTPVLTAPTEPVQPEVVKVPDTLEDRSVPFDVPVPPVAPKVSGLFAHLATS